MRDCGRSVSVSGKGEKSVSGAEVHHFQELWELLPGTRESARPASRFGWLRERVPSRLPHAKQFHLQKPQPTGVARKKRRIKKMSKSGKYLLLATGFAILASFALTPRAVIKVHASERGCSVASLKGTYAFRRTGVNNVVGGPIAQLGIDVFNGDGTRGAIRSTRSTNGDILDWADFPSIGSYTVDPDCTGSFFDAEGTKTNNLIVVDGGKRFFLLSVAPETITTEEGIRLEAKD
jgi:hypothetical protein